MYASVFLKECDNINLLPIGSEKRGVLGIGSIPVAMMPSCQEMKNIAVELHKHEYSWVLKVRNTSDVVFRQQYTPCPPYWPRPYGPWSVWMSIMAFIMCLLYYLYHYSDRNINKLRFSIGGNQEILGSRLINNSW